MVASSHFWYVSYTVTGGLVLAEVLQPPFYSAFICRCHLPLSQPSNQGRCRGTDGQPLPPAGGTFASGRHGGESFQAKVFGGDPLI